MKTTEGIGRLGAATAQSDCSFVGAYAAVAEGSVTKGLTCSTGSCQWQEEESAARIGCQAGNLKPCRQSSPRGPPRDRT